MKSVFGLLLMAFLATTSLPAQDPGYFLWRDTFCSNQLVLVNNNFYGPDNPSGTEILPGAASNGADSIIQIEFFFFAPVILNVQENLCRGDTLWFNNNPYHAMRWLGEEIISNGSTNGCDSIIRISLNVLPVPEMVLKDTLCSDSSIIINGRRYDRFQPFGKEIIPGSATNGCDSVILIDLVFRNLQLSLGPDRTLVLGDSLCLEAQINFMPSTLAWTPNEENCLDIPCLSWCTQPTTNTDYQLLATDTYGCSIADTIAVILENLERIYIPNVFDPGATLPNNRFFIQTAQQVNRIRQMLIIDRWGDLVYFRENFAPNSPDEGWDGTARNGDAAPQGVYAFKVRLEMLDGSIVDRSGDVTLLRRQ